MHVNAPSLHHWGYATGPAVVMPGATAIATTPQSHWVPPPQSHHSAHSNHSHGHSQGHSHGHGSLKRTLSESDCDDLYSEESSKEQCVFVTSNQSVFNFSTNQFSFETNPKSRNIF